MRVNCPNCAAGYEVPDHLLAAGGRTLRCARCGTTFQAGIAVAEPADALPSPPPSPSLSPSLSPVAIPPPPVTPTPAALEPPPPLTFPRAPPMPLDQRVEQRVDFHPPMVGARAHRSAGPGAALGVVGWLLTLLLLLGGGFEAVQQRSRIVAAWPASARAYDALGLNPAAAAGRSRPAATPPAVAP